MVFTSSIFLFVFLPVCVAVYYLPAVRKRRRARLWWLLVCSYVFYGWWRADFLGLIALVSVASYLVGRAVEPSRRRRTLWLVVGVSLNLGVLGYFKYFNFGVATLNALLGVREAGGIELWHVVLPVGLSFYVLQATSYIVDVYRGQTDPAPTLLELAAYVGLFPQLVAGPIVRYRDVRAQLITPQTSRHNFALGAGRFMLGFAKKILIADAVAPLVDAVFALPEPSVADAWHPWVRGADFLRFLGVLGYGDWPGLAARSRVSREL
jgi:alginate O-acetyltransferase complex protein AlgI